MSAKFAKGSNTSVILDRVRGSYLQHLQKATQKTDPATNQPIVDADGQPVKQFTAAWILDKTDTEGVTLLKQAMTNAAKAKFGDKIPPKWAKGLRDGDTDETALLDPSDPSKGVKPEYKGCYWFNSTAQEHRPPRVLGKTKDEFTGQLKALGPADYKSGDYFRVQINCYAFDAGVNKGVAFGIVAVQLVATGEALAGDAFDESAFGAVEDDEVADAFS